VLSVSGALSVDACQAYVRTVYV